MYAIRSYYANVSIVGSDNGRYVKVNEPGPNIGADDIARMKDKIKSSVGEGDWWVLAGSLPPGVPAEIYGELIEIIHGAGASVITSYSIHYTKLYERWRFSQK